MSFLVRFALLAFFFSSCGTARRTEEVVGLHSVADSVVCRELSNRRVQDLVLVREVLLNAPDSLGRQSVARVTETRRLLVETDSLSAVQQRVLRADEAELAVFKQEPPPVRSFPFVFLFLFIPLVIGGFCFVFKRW